MDSWSQCNSDETPRRGCTARCDITCLCVPEAKRIDREAKCYISHYIQSAGTSAHLSLHTVYRLQLPLSLTTKANQSCTIIALDKSNQQFHRCNANFTDYIILLRFWHSKPIISNPDRSLSKRLDNISASHY